MNISKRAKQVIVLVISLSFVVLGVGGSLLPQHSGVDTSNNQNNQDNNLANIMENLEIEQIKAGTGEEAKDGDTVSVHYTGTLTDGTKFDSSIDRGQPFAFILGANQVIPGWEAGILGMKEGGVRKLTIPPELAYGPNAVGPIPPNSTLVFEVELVEVR